jgi:uncharacterized protein YjeT (DUF2065 family)
MGGYMEFYSALKRRTMPKASPSPRMMSRYMSDLLVVAAILVFIIGIPLFLLPEQTEQYFAWTIASPLTATFLGAAYWSSCLLEWLASREKRWSHARIAVPAVLIFTVLTLIVTLLHLDRFHLYVPELITRFIAWVWMVIYISVPIMMTILLVMQLRAPGEDNREGSEPFAPWVRGLLIAQALIMVVLGIALLVVPTSVSPYWPWELTPLTGRAIGAWLTSLGVAAAQTAWENDYRRTRSALFSYALLVVLQLLALSRYPNEVAGSGLSLWLYLLFLGSMGVVAVATIRNALRH